MCGYYSILLGCVLRVLVSRLLVVILLFHIIVFDRSGARTFSEAGYEVANPKVEDEHFVDFTGTNFTAGFQHSNVIYFGAPMT